MKAYKEFYKTLKNNPKVIIEWAENEIKEYQNLIKLIKKGSNCPIKK